MAQGNDIDPRLRDIIQQSNPGQSDTSLASTSSPSIRSQPILQSPHQLQPSQHPQQYDPYVQSHNGAHTHAYYGPSPGQQYGQIESAGDLRAFPTAATVSHPGRLSLKLYTLAINKKCPFQAYNGLPKRA